MNRVTFYLRFVMICIAMCFSINIDCFDDLFGIMNNLERNLHISPNQDFSDSDSENEIDDDKSKEKKLNQIEREALIGQLLAEKKFTAIDTFDLMTLAELTFDFDSKKIKNLIDTAASNCLGGKVTTQDLFLTVYKFKPDLEIAADLRKSVLSKFLLPQYKINKFYSSLNTLIDLPKPTFNITNLHDFFKRVAMRASLNSTLVNNETIKHILMAYFKKYSITNISINLPIIPSAQDKENYRTAIPKRFIRFQQDNRFQLNVADQMSREGGGTLSCGYHVAKNGLLITRFLKLDENYFEMLTNTELTQAMSGSNTSFWRFAIIKQRQQKIAAALLSDALILGLSGRKYVIEQQQRPVGKDNLVFKLSIPNKWLRFESIGEEFDFDRQKLRELIPNVVRQWLLNFQDTIPNVPNSTNYNMTVRRENCITYFQDVIKQKIAEEPLVAHYKRLSKKEYFDSFFKGLSDVNIVIDNNIARVIKVDHPNSVLNQILTLSENAYSQSIGRNGELLGENLNGNEIAFLYNNSKSTWLNENYKRNAENQDNTVRGIIISDDNGNNPFLAIEPEILKDIQNPNRSLILACNVHLHNHWITLVMHKVRQNIRYYITDSNDNHTQINNPLVLRLIHYLETGEDESEIATQAYPKKRNFISTGHRAFRVICPEDITFDLDFDYVGKIPSSVIEAIDDIQGKNGSKTKNTLYLYGAPGLGKSSLAYGIAKKTGRKLILCTAANAIDKYQGSGSDTIKDLFKFAKETLKEPVIILIEEIDAIGKSRDLKSNDTTTINALLSLTGALDWYADDPSIFVVLTTNKVTQVDLALNSRLKEDLFYEAKMLSREEALTVLVDYYNKKANQELIRVELLELLPYLNNLDSRSIHGIVNNIITNIKDRSPTLLDWIDAIEECIKFNAAQERESDDEKAVKALTKELTQLQIRQIKSSMHTYISQRTRDNIKDGLYVVQSGLGIIKTGFDTVNAARSAFMPFNPFNPSGSNSGPFGLW